jgi:serine-type D-Ala-D-Ala carboxypeptidase/endopeptidase (penicillin-binding protein 4)
LTGRAKSAPALALLLVLGCGGRPSPATAPPRPTASTRAADTAARAARTPAVAALQGELEHLFNDGPVTAMWGIAVQSFDTGEMLYEQESDLPLIPASNMKILTMAAAASRLGWDHRFETRLEAHGPIADGTLAGDLVVVGGGDPGFGGPLDDAAPVFGEWSDALQRAGVRRVSGRVVGDASALAGQGLGEAWAWDDLAAGYSTPSSALSFRENVVEVVIGPGPAAGWPAIVEVTPEGHPLEIVNLAKTAEPGTAADIDLWRPPGSTTLEIRGVVPANGEKVRRTASVQDPGLFFARALRAALVARGIEISGPAAARHTAEPSLPTPGGSEVERRVIATHTSKPLREIGTRFMKVSQNLYGELLFRTLGRQAVEETLSRFGVAPGQNRIADGSGLSRRNFVTARTLLIVLRRMASDLQHAEPFVATLPVAGEDGTLASRLKGTRAASNVRAKTGSLAHVRTLSGYVRTRDNELLGFSILANNFLVPSSSIDAIVDLAVERLANFKR